jgi:pimeloyl-ACP methyl ester carboxylesterase
MSRLRVATCLLVLTTLLGCTARGDPTQPIPTAFIAAPQPATRLFVVLPGRADDLAGLRDSGIAQAVQSQWPDTDVVLAEVTLDYYNDGHAPERLRREVIAPARERGYSEIWLGGASLGGTGTLLYDATYPGEVDGMVLLAPYVGERELLDEIVRAGGVAAWEPGPPQPITADTWQREVWRNIHDWTLDRSRARRVWLAYGDADRLRKAMPILVSVLPAEQVFIRDGGHTWTVWTPAMQDILSRARSTAPTAGASR